MAILEVEMSKRRARFDFSDCQVVVTGGTSGIGLGIAQAFAESGATVHITGRKADPSDYARDLSAFQYHRFDAFESDGVAKLASEIDSVDILINNAGGAFPRGEDEWGEQGFRDSIEINLMSYFRVASAFRDRLALSTLEGGASVIGIGSLTSYFGLEVVPGYGAAKGALVQLTKTLAVSWVKYGIRCNLIAAGNIHTPMNAGMTEEQFRNLYARLPIKRQGEPEDVAGAALYLSSPLASYVTGQTLAVDGGYTVAMYL